MPTLRRTGDPYIVYQDDRRIGLLRLYDNPHHIRNCYVKLELDEWNTEISAELFKMLREVAGRPLQVMVDSDGEPDYEKACRIRRSIRGRRITRASVMNCRTM